MYNRSPYKPYVQAMWYNNYLLQYESKIPP